LDALYDREKSGACLREFTIEQAQNERSAKRLSGQTNVTDLFVISVKALAAGLQNTG
jgi:hypothetical protein